MGNPRTFERGNSMEAEMVYTSGLKQRVDGSFYMLGREENGRGESMLEILVQESGTGFNLPAAIRFIAPEWSQRGEMK
jgi:hypothetical protein